MENKAQDDDLVMNLVDLALDLPAQERRAYLEGACAGDSELFDQAWEYVQWEARMQGFLLEPLYPPPLIEHPFEPGELLDGRFRILREVAQGGMGVVYEAMDERLERRIAIKCAKTGFRKRLPPEVRNAREISHPNVCKIFEIHTAATRHGDLDFLSMEFIDGETLAERLRRGVLPETEARLIARQLCAGLAEAHRNQVIHGDLKSNNIILTTTADGATRAVITDFGMARTPGTGLRTMQTGPLGGTPDYMAPELWKGEKATVASDIYALGVMLYELVSGKRPPPSQESSAKVFPPLAVHPKWDRTLAHCLEPDPSRRFRSAAEVAQAFEPSYTRRWFLAAAAAVVLAAASGVFTYQRATAPQETVRLAVLPFASSPDTAALAGRALRDAATQIGRLRSSPGTKFTMIPLTNTLRNQADTIDKARTLLGATHALQGTLQKEKDRVVLHVFLTDTRTHVNARDWRAVYAPGEVRYAGVALAGMMTGTLRLPPLLAMATVNVAAQRDYWSGLYYLRRETGDDQALSYMERAVAADPDSPLPYAGLAEAQWFKYGTTKDKLWLERAEESVRQAELRDLDLAEVHLIAGLLKANTGFYEQAVRDYERTIELQPNNGDAYRRLGRVYELNNQLDEALAAFQKAVVVQPDYYKPYQDLGAFHFQRGRYSEAAKQFSKAVALDPGEPGVHFALASAYTNLGRYGDAESELRLATGMKETATAVHALGMVLMYQSRDQDAIPYFLRAIELSPDRYLSWMDLGICYRRTDRPAEAAKANQRGLELAEVEMAKNPRDGYVRSFLAYLCARTGDRRRAESEIAQALQLSPNDADTRWMAALTDEALGRRNETLGVLAASPSELLSDLSRWPDVADLHKDSRFLDLLVSHGVR